MRPDANLVLIEVDPACQEASELISSLDAELRELYPGMPVHGIDPADFRRDGGVFLIARLDGATVACGALRILAGGAGELKRVFVRKDQRGNGFAKAIVQALEKIAAGRACQTIRLETGPRQSEAIALYRSLGYRRVATVEEHSLDSWYFEKSPGWPRG